MQPAPVSRNRCCAAQNRACGCCAQGDKEGGGNQFDLTCQPVVACGNFRIDRFLVKTALAASARVRSWPAGPTKGRPVRSSWSPGCSPISMTGACAGPSPKTVCVAFSHSGQARQARRLCAGSQWRFSSCITRRYRGL